MSEREVEVKVLGMDTQALEKRARDLGADFIKEEHQVNYTLDSSTHPIDQDLGYLRIRLILKEGQVSHQEVTFKKTTGAQKARENLEFTSEIGDHEALLEVFSLLGYDQVSRGEKLRRSYKFMGGRLDFDSWDKATYPYPYLEIEGRDSSHVAEIAQALAIPQDRLSTRSISQLQEDLKKSQERV